MLLELLQLIKQPNHLKKISDGWYGTDSDLVNNKSQYKACSYGDLIFEPVTNNKLFMNGINTVKITDTVTGMDNAVIREAVLAQVTTNLGN